MAVTSAEHTMGPYRPRCRGINPTAKIGQVALCTFEGYMEAEGLLVGQAMGFAAIHCLALGKDGVRAPYKGVAPPPPLLPASKLAGESWEKIDLHSSANSLGLGASAASISDSWVRSGRESAEERGAGGQE